MKRFYLILAVIVVLCAAVFWLSSLPLGFQSWNARDGVLDLKKTGWEASLVTLDGEWEFVYGELLTPEQFPLYHGERGLVSLPAEWEEAGYPQFGCGTYRLTIKTGAQDNLMLFIPEIIDSSAIYINGELVFTAGQVSDDAQSARSGVRNAYLPVSPVHGALELVIQSSNYEVLGSGLSYPLHIGRTDKVLLNAFRQRSIVAACLGAILIIGLYHLVLFLFRRRERVYLAFFFTCLFTVLRMSMETNSMVQLFLKDGMGPALSRIYLLLFALHTTSILVFMQMAFRLQLGTVSRLICRVVPAALILSTILLPPWINISLLTSLLLPCAVILVLGARQAGVRQDPYRLLYLCSTALFIIYGPVTKTLLEYTLYVPGVVSNLFMVLCQFVMLSRDYAEARNEVERVNTNLESLVKERTGQLEKANALLDASHTALRDSIRNVSHDLNTPVTAVHNALEILSGDPQLLTEVQLQRLVEIAFSRNRDVQRLIKQLLDTSRLEGGTAAFHCSWVPAAELAQATREKYTGLAEQKEISFQVYADETVQLYMDMDKMWSVLDNLVYNAMRHTPKGGTITVQIFAEGERAKLVVADTGEGIAQQHLPHIFDRFYKVSPERGIKDGSSGLGLYIAKGLVEGMGGSIEAESALGVGTSFTLQFRRT